MTPYIDYIRWRTGYALMTVRCKGDCKKVLVQRRGVGQNLRLDKTNDYGEIVFEMRLPNGLLGKHETAMCYECRQRLCSGGALPGELMAIYAQDVFQWVESAIYESHMTKADAEKMVARFAAYVPVRVLDEPSRGSAYYG